MKSCFKMYAVILLFVALPGVMQAAEKKKIAVDELSEIKKAAKDDESVASATVFSGKEMLTNQTVIKDKKPIGNDEECNPKKDTTREVKWPIPNPNPVQCNNGVPGKWYQKTVQECQSNGTWSRGTDSPSYLEPVGSCCPESITKDDKPIGQPYLNKNCQSCQKYSIDICKNLNWKNAGSYERCTAISSGSQSLSFGPCNKCQDGKIVGCNKCEICNNGTCVKKPCPPPPASPYKPSNDPCCPY